MSKKLQKFFTVLRQSQEILDLLEGSGLDIDRIIGISNAQGPGAKLVRGIMFASIGHAKPEEIDSDLAAVSLAQAGILRDVTELGNEIIAQKKLSGKSKTKRAKQKPRVKPTGGQVKSSG